MSDELNQFGLGQGVYSVTDASALTGLYPRRIVRWFRGYTYRATTGHRSRPPVIQSDYSPVDGLMQLSFLDLIEMRLVKAFLDAGVGWKELRLAATRAAEMLGNKHPFATMKFKTDGRRIMADIAPETGDVSLIQVSSQQHLFRSLVAPYLRDLEFDDSIVVRWAPLGRKRQVIIDPQRAFGAPIARQSGVPTRILALFANATSEQRAASWYCVSLAEVRDAVRFERQLAA